jgi:hypothetical protein
VQRLKYNLIYHYRITGIPATKDVEPGTSGSSCGHTNHCGGGSERVYFEPSKRLQISGQKALAAPKHSRTVMFRAKWWRVASRMVAK